MKYSYKYPLTLQRLNGLREGQILINDEHLSQTHVELMNRLDDPSHSIIVFAEIDAPLEGAWKAAAWSIGSFFSHQPGFAGLAYLNTLRSEEGGRFVVHRVYNGLAGDRIGEVMVNLNMSQLTVSDIDIADPSVSGRFPSLFTVKVEQHPDDPARTMLQVMYTVLGVPRPHAIEILLHQAHSIKQAAERRVKSEE